MNEGEGKMARATKELSDEHQNILKVIGALVQECDAIDGGKEVDREFFSKAVDFIRNYADKFHHAKEEDILFKELDRPGVEMHCDPRQQMLHEHDLGRSFVKGIENGVSQAKKEQVVENARGYARLLQEHIYKEDNILYPMAENALGEERSEEMAGHFRAVNEDFAEANEKHLSFAQAIMTRAPS
jgi:hemerythrin-like domain-containing protein